MLEESGWRGWRPGQTQSPGGALGRPRRPVQEIPLTRNPKPLPRSGGAALVSGVRVGCLLYKYLLGRKTVKAPRESLEPSKPAPGQHHPGHSKDGHLEVSLGSRRPAQLPAVRGETQPSSPTASQGARMGLSPQPLTLYQHGLNIWKVMSEKHTARV